VEAYAGEIERSLLNVVLAAISADGFGIRYFARLHQHKDGASNVSTCCEGQGTRELGALPEFLFSTSARGVHLHLFQAATLAVEWAGAQLQVEVDTLWPFAEEVTVRVGVAGGSAPTALVSLVLRAPAWLAVPELNVSVTDTSGAQRFVLGARGSYDAEVVLAPAALPATLAFSLPMAFASTLYTGYDQIGNATRFALELGPVLLAAVGPLTPIGKDAAVVLPSTLDPARPQDWLSPVAGAPLHFAVAGVPGVTIVPYFEVQEESFDVYPIFGGGF
jgi:hypothetical protein